MRILEFLFLLILMAALVASLYFLYINLPTEPIEFETFRSNISKDLPTQSFQFYSNMRFPSKNLGYKLSEQCDSKKRDDFEDATLILEQKTILEFHKSDNPDIVIFCSNIVPEAEKKNHFIAGEAGPTEIINSSKYAIILAAEISLYRTETCPTPQVSIHELLHALGFNHNSNKESIMYPVTNCRQEIDQEIIDQINMLYKESPLGDLAIESVKADKTGRYLNFEITITNEGLKDMGKSDLKIFVDGTIINTFIIDELDIGTKRFLTVKNQRIPRDVSEITFILETTEQELTKENNQIQVSAVQTG